MIDLRRITYNAVLLSAAGKAYVLDNILQNLSWEENPGELSQRASLLFANKEYQSSYVSSIAVPGVQLFIYSDWGAGKKEVFRGPIWDYDYQSAIKKDLTLAAYDNFIYMQQSEDYKWFANGTSSKAMLNEIFKDWGIPIGRFDGPDVKMAKKVFKGEKISDMILAILDDAKKKGAGVYIPRSVQGQGQIVKRGSNTDVYKFEADKNVIMTGEHISLDDLVTRVKIVGKEAENERTPVEAIVNGKTEFGILQTVVHRNQDDTLAAAKSSANEILNERGKPKNTKKLEAPDLPFLRKGDKIFVAAGSLNGYHYITGIQHDATNRTMTMEVEI